MSVWGWSDLGGCHAFAHGDAAEVSSSFDWDATKDVPIQGWGDRVNSETKAGDDDAEGDSEFSEGDSSGSEPETRWRDLKVAAAIAAGLTFGFNPSFVTKGRILEMEDLGYFPKGDGKIPGEEVVLEPQWDEVIIFEDYFVDGLLIPANSHCLPQLIPNVMVQLWRRYYWSSKFNYTS
jgi:hypothetical protein